VYDRVNLIQLPQDGVHLRALDKTVMNRLINKRWLPS